MTTTRNKILIGLKTTKISQARELEPIVGTDEHNIIHLLHGLRKQGLISFRIDTRGKVKEPYKITLTKQGERAVDGLRRTK